MSGNSAAFLPLLSAHRTQAVRIASIAEAAPAFGALRSKIDLASATFVAVSDLSENRLPFQDASEPRLEHFPLPRVSVCRWRLAVVFRAITRSTRGRQDIAPNACNVPLGPRGAARSIASPSPCLGQAALSGVLHAPLCHDTVDPIDTLTHAQRNPRATRKASRSPTRTRARFSCQNDFRVMTRNATRTCHDPLLACE